LVAQGDIPAARRGCAAASTGNKIFMYGGVVVDAEGQNQVSWVHQRRRLSRYNCFLSCYYRVFLHGHPSTGIGFFAHDTPFLKYADQ
jgi:hypothetical protein